MIKQRSSYTPYHSNILTGYEPGLNALPVRNRSIFAPVEHDVFLLVETNWRSFFSAKTAFEIVTQNKKFSGKLTPLPGAVTRIGAPIA